MRRTGTTASERWSSPRRMRRRSPSRATVKPANETIAPIAESAQAASSSPPSASSQPPGVSGSSRDASSMSRSLEITLPNSWVEAASTGRTTPSWPAVSAATSRSRRLSRRSITGGASAASASAGCSPTAARRRSTACGPRASSTISPLDPPPADWTWSATTPNRRCTGPATVSRLWIRLSGTVVCFVLTMPVLKWIPCSSTPYVVLPQRTRPVSVATTTPITR